MSVRMIGLLSLVLSQLLLAPLVSAQGVLPRAQPLVGQATSKLTPATVATAAQGPITQLKLVNSYPKNAAQTKMWTSWDPASIDQDFARIAALQANAVR